MDPTPATFPTHPSAAPIHVGYLRNAWRFPIDRFIVNRVRKPLAAARRSLAAGCFTLLVSKLAFAQTPASPPPDSEPSFSIVVERDDLAGSCPDLSWFTARIASHAGKVGHAGHFEITLAK